MCKNMNRRLLGRRDSLSVSGFVAYLTSLGNRESLHNSREGEREREVVHQLLDAHAGEVQAVSL